MFFHTIQQLNTCITCSKMIARQGWDTCIRTSVWGIIFVTSCTERYQGHWCLKKRSQAGREGGRIPLCAWLLIFFLWFDGFFQKGRQYLKNKQRITMSGLPNSLQSPIPKILTHLSGNQLFCAFQNEMCTFWVEIRAFHSFHWNQLLRFSIIIK